MKNNMTTAEKFQEIRGLCSDIIEECEYENALTEDTPFGDVMPEDMADNYNTNEENIEMAVNILKLFKDEFVK